MGLNETKRTAEVAIPELGDFKIKTIPVPKYEPEDELWKPERFNSTRAEMTENERNTIAVRRSITSLLNKLTPENFSTISEKIRTLPVDSSVKMQQVVEIIHIKAISEWKYCALYVKICDLMQEITVVDEFGITKTFLLYLIAKCENYFVNSLSEDFRFDRRKYEIHLCFDTEIKKSLMREYEENEREFRRKSVGNCQFVGELFKAYLIHPEIIFLMLNKLLKANGNMALECTCALLTTIGLFYEERIKKLPAVYFNTLESLLSNKELSFQVLFMIQDVLDLKKSSWRPKKILELPKTRQQIEQDIIEEKKNEKLAISVSRLGYGLKKMKIKGRKWTHISVEFSKHIAVPKGRKKENQAKSIATLETTVSEDKEDTTEYIFLVPNEKKEVSMNNCKKLPTSPEKSHETEKLFDVVQVNSFSTPIDAERNIFSVKSKEELVVHDRKKYNVEFLKSFRHLPECNKFLEVNPRLPNRIYPHGFWTSEKSTFKFINTGHATIAMNGIRRNELENIPSLLSLRVTPPYENFAGKLLESAFKQWTPNKNFPHWFESEKHKLIAKVLPEDISQLIGIALDHVKCGQFFVSLIKNDYIPSEIIFKGLGCFFSAVENQRVPDEIELVLRPLCENECLKLDDLNTIFQSNSDLKPIENEEKGAAVSQNDLAPKKLVIHSSSVSQPKMQNVLAETPLVPSSSYFDAFSSVTRNTSDLIVQNSEDDVKSKPIYELIVDLLKAQTPDNFNPFIFKRQLQNIPFRKFPELNFAAFCVIKMVEENPDWHAFYVRLCCPMLGLAVEKNKFWVRLMFHCYNYLYQKVLPEDESKKTRKVVIFKGTVDEDKLTAVCRFFSSLVNTLSNETGIKSVVQRIMKKLLDSRNIVCFCKIYDCLDRTEARFEKSIFESYIPELLSTNELTVEYQEMLRRVVEDYTSTNRVAFCSTIVSTTNDHQQHQAAVTNPEISLECNEQQNVTGSSSLPNDVNISSCDENRIVSSNEKTDFSDESLSESAPSSVTSSLANPKKKKEKEKEKKKKKTNKVVAIENNEFAMSRSGIDAIVANVFDELRSHPDSSEVLSKRISSIRIVKHALLLHVILRIYSNAMKDGKFGKPYVVLCEHLQNWFVITDKKTVKPASFKSELISIIHLKCKQIKAKIADFKRNGQEEKNTGYDLRGRIIGYFRFLCEFLKSPVYGSNLLIFPAMELVLLLDDIDGDVLDLLEEFSKILLKDLDFKFKMIESKLRSSQPKDDSSQLFEKYNELLKIIVSLQDILDFRKCPNSSAKDSVSTQQRDQIREIIQKLNSSTFKGYKLSKGVRD